MIVAAFAGDAAALDMAHARFLAEAGVLAARRAGLTWWRSEPSLWSWRPGSGF